VHPELDQQQPPPRIVMDRSDTWSISATAPRLAAAQVHATLALAAATVLGRSDLDSREWHKIADTELGG
jgi:hypothetical protein